MTDIDTMNLVWGGGVEDQSFVCEDYYYQKACLIELSLPAIGSLGLRARITKWLEVNLSTQLQSSVSRT